VLTAAGRALFVPNLCEMAHEAGLEMDPDIMYQVRVRADEAAMAPR
jgi:hypothetical protein